MQASTLWLEERGNHEGQSIRSVASRSNLRARTILEMEGDCDNDTQSQPEAQAMGCLECRVDALKSEVSSLSKVDTGWTKCGEAGRLVLFWASVSTPRFTDATIGIRRSRLLFYEGHFAN